MIPIKDQRSHSPPRIHDSLIIHPQCYLVKPITGKNQRSKDQNPIVHKMEHTTFGEIYKDNRYETKLTNEDIPHLAKSTGITTTKTNLPTWFEQLKFDKVPIRLRPTRSKSNAWSKICYRISWLTPPLSEKAPIAKSFDTQNRTVDGNPPAVCTTFVVKMPISRWQSLVY